MKTEGQNRYVWDFPKIEQLDGGIGHAIGLDIIEPPFIDFENDVLLEEGMILTVEPALKIDGAFIMIEEDVLVTAQGHEVLSTPAPAELLVL